MPALVADTIVWLTQEKQAWLNGRNISANWDMEKLLSRKQEIVDGGKLMVQLLLWDTIMQRWSYEWNCQIELEYPDFVLSLNASAL